MARLCSVEGCGGEHDARGLCNKHYKQRQREENPDRYYLTELRKTYSREYYLKHREEYLARGRRQRELKGPEMKEYLRKYYLDKKDKIRWKNIWVNYRLRPEDVERLSAAQRGRCPICKLPLETHAKGAQIDHCHASGKVRGLLCENCNRGLGSFKDSTLAMTRAIAYVLKHKR